VTKVLEPLSPLKPCVKEALVGIGKNTGRLE